MMAFECPHQDCDKQLKKLQVQHFKYKHDIKPVEWVKQEFGDKISKWYKEGYGAYNIAERLGEEYHNELINKVIHKLGISRTHHKAITEYNHMKRKEMKEWFSNNNPMENEESLKKLAETNKNGEIRECKVCGEKFYTNPTEDKKYCSNECWLSTKKFKESCVKGENHPNWKGGISKEPYGKKWTKKLREKVRKRDNYECQFCGLTQAEHYAIYNEKLHVHHIDKNKKNNSSDNLITLCHSCHISWEWSRYEKD